MKLIHKATLAAFALSSAVAFGGPLLGQQGITDRNKGLARALEGFDMDSLMNVLRNLPSHEAEYLLAKMATIKRMGGYEDFIFRSLGVSDPKWARKDCSVSAQASDELTEQFYCNEITPRGSSGSPESHSVRDAEIMDMSMDNLVIFRSKYSADSAVSFPLQILSADGEPINTRIEQINLTAEIELPVNSAVVLDPSPWEITYTITLTGRNLDVGEAFQLKVENIEPYDTLYDQMTTVEHGIENGNIMHSVDAVTFALQHITLSPEEAQLFAPLINRLAETYES